MTTETELARASKELREHLGLTQSDFARRLGVGISTVQRIEDELRGPTWDNLKQLTDVAVEAGRRDIVGVFVRTFRSHYGQILTESAPQKKGNATEEKYVDILRDILRSEPEMARSLITWLDLFQQQRGKKR